MTTAAVYCRVSTTNQREDRTSLDTQRDQAMEKASGLGWAVREDYVIQEDWTGKDLNRTMLPSADGIIPGTGFSECRPCAASRRPVTETPTNPT